MITIAVSTVTSAYLLCALVWFLVECFIYDRKVQRALLMGAAWPVLVYKLKTGRKNYPSRNR